MSMPSRRETISYGKPNRLKTFRPDFRPGGEGPQGLHRGGESGARASDDSDDRALLRSHPTAVIPCRVRPGVRGTRRGCLEVGLICTSSTGTVLPTGSQPRIGMNPRPRGPRDQDTFLHEPNWPDRPLIRRRGYISSWRPDFRLIA